jgi:hypothetical protein
MTEPLICGYCHELVADRSAMTYCQLVNPTGETMVWAGGTSIHLHELVLLPRSMWKPWPLAKFFIGSWYRRTRWNVVGWLHWWRA